MVTARTMQFFSYDQHRFFFLIVCHVYSIQFRITVSYLYISFSTLVKALGRWG